jgi:uncharacterized protein YoxC
MLEWSVFAIAVLFLLLVVMTIVVLIKAIGSLQRIDRTVEKLQGQLEQVNAESLELLRKANHIVGQVESISDSVQHKLKTILPLASILKFTKLGFDSISMFRKSKKQKGE